MSLADIIQIIIGGLSLIATIAVSFLIYWLQSRHEKEIRSIEETQRQKALEEQANQFLIDYEEERDYLPWCIFAANLHRLEKHKRKIYTAYCRCSVELQNAILKVAGFSIKQFENKDWLNKCIDYLRRDIKKYELGEDYLYEGAKYFHRGYEYYRNNKWNKTPEIFTPIVNLTFRQAFNRTKIDISTYIDEYIFYYIGKEIPQTDLKPCPPIDYVWDSQKLAYEEKEEIVCQWIMELVNEISIILKNRQQIESIIEYSDAIIETFEDKYYCALQSLYNTYIAEYNLNIINTKKKKRIKQKRSVN